MGIFCFVEISCADTVGRGVFQSVHYPDRTKHPTINITNPYLDFSEIYYPWASLEPQEGVYQWSDLDNYISLWHAQGKKIIIGVTLYTKGGKDPDSYQATPQWVFDAGAPKFTMTDTDTGKTLTWPVPWNPIFLAKYHDFINAFAAKYDGNPGIENVNIGLGLFETTRLALDDPPAALPNFIANGYNPSTKEPWLSTINQVMDFYINAFHKTMLRIGDSYLTNCHAVSEDYCKATRCGGGIDDSFPQMEAIAKKAASYGIVIFDHGLKAKDCFLNGPWLGLYEEIHNLYPNAKTSFGTDNPTANNPTAYGVISDIVRAAFGGDVPGFGTYPESHINYLGLYVDDITRATPGSATYDQNYVDALEYVVAHLGNGTIDGIPPTLSYTQSSPVTSDSATITWATDEAADSQVEYGTTISYGSETALDSNRVTSHTRYLTSLSPGTLYHYRVKSRDAGGNLTTGDDNTFTTEAGSDMTPPTLSAFTLVPTPTNDTTPDFTFSSDEAGVITYGGDCSSSTTSAIAGENTITFNALSEGAYSNCTITATDFSNNVSNPLSINSFTIDTTPPIISSISSDPLANSATITWTTDEAADSQVEYGQTQSYGSQTLLDSSGNTSHSQDLTDLSPATSYHFRIKSRDAAGNLTVSDDNTLTTQAAFDTSFPSIPPNLSASAASYSQIDISWDTSTDDVGVTGYHLYRDGTLIATTTDDTFVSDTDLSPATTYFYTVSAYDAAGNESSQSNPVFTETLPRTYDIDDFNNLVHDWLQAKSSPTDINGDGIINSRDMGIMMSDWEGN